MRIVIALCCLFTLALASGCSSIRSLDQNEVPTYTLNQVRSQPKKALGDLKEGEVGVIVSVPKGERMPFDIMARLPFATLVTTGNWIYFDQDVWLYFAKNDMMISPDGERFGPVYDMRALKKLFNFEAGQMALGFGVTSEGGARASLTLLSKEKE
jgi:hypothetical protein